MKKNECRFKQKRHFKFFIVSAKGIQLPQLAVDDGTVKDKLTSHINQTPTP